MKELMPHENRMLLERKQLKLKIDSLAYFISFSEFFNDLNPEQKENLKEQCECMCSYLEVLESRIADCIGDYSDLQVQFNFGLAVEMMKAGKKVARIGWNGEGMYSVLMKGCPEGVPANKETASIHGIAEGDIIKIRPYYALKTAQGDIAAWAPSGSDTLAEDWIEIN